MVWPVPSEWKSGGSILQKAVRLWKSGESLADLSRTFLLSRAGVRRRLVKYGGICLEVAKKCAFPGCSNVIRTHRRYQKYCCRKHKSLGYMLEHQRCKWVWRECRLPECREIFRTHRTLSGKTKQNTQNYCCLLHAQRHRMRVKATGGTSIYRAILGVGPSCIVCDESLVVDTHHVVFKNNKSDKESRTIPLCPTHHMALHRGLARYTKHGYVWVYKKILRGLKKKHPKLVRRLQRESEKRNGKDK